MPDFSVRSRENLNTCECSLKQLFMEVIKEYDCTILEGHRDMETQKQYFRDGKTKTLSSKHLYLPSKAVDVMPYPIDWENKEEHYKFAAYVFSVANRLGIKVRWGGHFKGFYDAPHWEVIDDLD